MTKKLIFIFNIIVIIYLFSNITEELVDMKSNKESVNNSGTTYEDIQINLLIEEGISDNVLSNVEVAFKKVPSKLIKMFQDDNWTIQIVSKIKDEENISGLTDYKEKSIYILGDNLGQEVETLIHEMGHYLDYKLGFISEKEEFNLLYNKYSNDYIEYQYKNFSNIDLEEMNYLKTNNKEFFASTFKDYIVAPIYIEETAPGIHKFINKIIKDL